VKGNSQKLPSLDGWRMVSISLVLLAHCVYATGFPENLQPGLDWFGLGDLGVRFFFVISGFLITWLLLQEQEKHAAISLKNFYIRRALRILPVYFLYLFILGFLTRYSQSTSAWLANLTFTTNFFWSPFPTAHLWSLGVEEQFYLLWPWFLVMAFNQKESGSKLLRLLLVPLVAAPFVRMMDCKQWYPQPLHHLFQNGSFFERSDSLAYGCVAAVLLTHWRGLVELVYNKNPRRLACGGMVLLLAPAILRALHFPSRFQAASFSSMQAFGFSLLLLQSLLYPHRGFYRFLNWKWVSHLGVLSYSIYIWQQMFCGTGETMFGVKDAWWTRFPIWIAAALVVAHASYYLFEKPFFKLRAKFRDA
jgi:peptidoglycan/LPS O-acetylase OafA/YrhL